MAEKKNNKKPTLSIQNIIQEFGKLPPQAVELEEAVLGALMLEKDAVISILDLLKPESFYKEAHQKIYQAIVDLSIREQPIDILTVTEELKQSGNLDSVGGPFYVTQLTSRVASAAHIEYHSRIIEQKYIQRELIRVSSEIQNRAFDEGEDVSDLLEFAENQLFAIAEGNIKKETLKINTVIQQAIKQIEEASKREDGLSGVPSGFTQVDRITSGWQRSDLIIVAARPSMGKTAFVLSMTRNMAVEHNRAVALFSLEMSSIQLVNRLIVAETELASDKIKNGKLEPYEWEQLEYKIKKLDNARIFIDDTPAISVFELRAKCRRLSMQQKIDMIIIDYLQLMTVGGDSRGGGSREQEVSTISRSLKAIAKELNVPVIALSQLNRSVEMRSGDKRPQLSDLRESGAIEQDADVVLFIHRPERYGLTEDEEGNSLIGLAEIIIAKHRNGAVGDVQLKFESHFAKFSDLDSGLEDFGDVEAGGSGVTFSSKMNAELESNNDLVRNTGFDAEQPF